MARRGRFRRWTSRSSRYEPMARWRWPKHPRTGSDSVDAGITPPEQQARITNVISDSSDSHGGVTVRNAAGQTFPVAAHLVLEFGATGTQTGQITCG
jgi:hypothetical protein